MQIKNSSPDVHLQIQMPKLHWLGGSLLSADETETAQIQLTPEILLCFSLPDSLPV